MYRNIYLCIALCVQTPNVWSQQETTVCPSVEELQNQVWTDWQPLYINHEELASDADVQKFRSHVTQFTVAKWSTTYLENGHCFYQGTDPIVDHIVYAHDAWRPVSNGVWSWFVADRFAECRSSHVEDCPFIL